MAGGWGQWIEIYQMRLGNLPVTLTSPCWDGGMRGPFSQFRPSPSALRGEHLEDKGAVLSKSVPGLGPSPPCPSLPVQVLTCPRLAYQTSPSIHRAMGFLLPVSD